MDQFCTNVHEAFVALKQKHADKPDKELMTLAVSVVDQSHKEHGLAGLVKRPTEEDLEKMFKEKCLVEEGKEGPDIYLYTCYPEGDDPKSNTAGFTTYQLEQFAKVHQGLPVYLNHETSIPVGVTVVGGVNKKGEMMGGMVFHNTPLGKLAHELVEKGGIRGVSLGADHQPQMVNGVLQYTHAVPTEVSLCVLGDQKGTWIRYKMPWGERMRGPDAQLTEFSNSLNI